MPALRNQRQERFARELAKGLPQYKAYKAAGYRASKASTLRAASSRSLTYANVKTRLQELNAMSAAKAAVTAETIAQQLDEDRLLAFRTEQAGAAVAASMAKAKLFGLVVSKSESGQPGEFNTLSTPQEVIDKVRNELGEDVAAVLAKAFGLDTPTATHDNPESVNLSKTHAMSATFEAWCSK